MTAPVIAAPQVPLPVISTSQDNPAPSAIDSNPPNILTPYLNGLADSVPVLPTAARVAANMVPTGRYDSSTGTYLPDGASVQQNMQDASQRQPWNPLDLNWFKDMVQKNGPWDYHGNLGDQYENAGNFNYGAAGTAMGLPPGILDRTAGAYHMLKHGYNPDLGNPLGGAPYGNSTQDLWEINRGIVYAKNRGY